MSNRQKSKSETDIPLLPKAIEIMERYKNHPICIQRNSVLPVKSNQKMNEYLKEIATLCDFSDTLNTHKARRTFGSTVTLKNGVPLHIVKEMMGHYSVKQTEEYAITEQESVGIEMQQLKEKLIKREKNNNIVDPIDALFKLQQEINDIKNQNIQGNNDLTMDRINKIAMDLNSVKELLLRK
jgi:Phage integrase family.